MSIHFHPIRIKEVKKETSDCISVLFEIPNTLKEEFSFCQGQSLTLRTFLNGVEIRRTYSICSSPLEDEWRIAIKKVDGGLFSGFANTNLKEGDILEVMPPVGKFYTELIPANKKNYLAIAAGSGITPVISIIKTTLITEPNSNFTLVYSNQRRSSIIFFEELQSLKNKYINRFDLINILSREKTEFPINSGRISIDKLIEVNKLISYERINEFFLCGPEEMIFCVKDFLSQKGIDEKNIHFELFTSLTLKKAKPVTWQSTTGKDLQTNITVKTDGRSFDFTLPLNSNLTILDAALQQSADLPFACKGGMCCTCKAKLLEGEVDMDVHWGLEKEEVEKGYILTCQSHPKTERVVIDFDIK